MKAPKLPKPPPLRHLHTHFGWLNEYETIKWYTEQGKRYPNEVSKFRMIFDDKLREAYEENLTVAVDE